MAVHSVEQETIVENVNLASHRYYNNGTIWNKQGAVAPKQTGGPLIFISKFQFL